MKTIYDPFKDVRKINIPLENLKSQVNLSNNIKKHFESQIDMASLKSAIYAPQRELIESLERMNNSLTEMQRSTIEKALESISLASNMINDYSLSMTRQLNDVMKLKVTPSLNLQYSATISEIIDVPRFNVSKALETIEERYAPHIEDEYDLDATRFNRAFPITHAFTQALLFNETITLFKSGADFLFDHLMLIVAYFCLTIILKGYEEEHKS